MAWAPFIVLHSSSSNLLSGEGQKHGKKKEGKKGGKKVEPALISFFSTNYNLSFIWHFIGHIYLCFFPLTYLSLSHYSLVLIEFLHFGGNSGNCRHKLAGKKPGVRKAAPGGCQMPKPKVLLTAACLEHFGVSEQEQSSGLWACILHRCKFCILSNHRLWRQN